MKDPIKYYNRQYPELNEMVMIRIDNIGESCVNVTLMEYDIEGIIVFKELWHRRLRKRNLRQAAPIGRCMPAQVMTANEDGEGLVTLTKKRIKPEEIKEFSKKFGKNKKVISIVENLSHKCNLNFKDTCKKIIHPLNKTFIESGNETDDAKTYETLYDLMEANKNDFQYLDDIELKDDVREQLQEIITKNFKEEDVKLSAKIAMVSNSLEGIKVVKNVLLDSEKENDEFNYYLDKTPYYNIEIVTNDIDTYSKKLNQIVDNIKTRILSENGQFKLIEKSY